MHIVIAHPFDIVAGSDRRFSYNQFVWRNPRQQTDCGVQGGFESAQIAVIDAKQSGFQCQCGIQFLRIMHLDQYVHAKLVRTGLKLTHESVVERSHDKQNAVGAP